MAAVGCLLPFVLLLAGAVAGAGIGGERDGLWGGGIGLVIGLALMVAVFWGFERARQNWPR